MTQQFWEDWYPPKGNLAGDWGKDTNELGGLSPLGLEESGAKLKRKPTSAQGGG